MVASFCAERPIFSCEGSGNAGPYEAGCAVVCYIAARERRRLLKHAGVCESV